MTLRPQRAHTHTHTQREREREREQKRGGSRQRGSGAGSVCDDTEDPGPSMACEMWLGRTSRSTTHAERGGGVAEADRVATATTSRQCRQRERERERERERQRGGQEWEDVARSEARAQESPLLFFAQAWHAMCDAVRDCEYTGVTHSHRERDTGRVQLSCKLYPSMRM